MTRAGTLWRTVRHLKASQVVGRVAFRLRRPRPNLASAPPKRRASGRFVTPARRKPSLVEPATFDLLSRRHALDAVDWDGPSLPRLWRYHQHYFDDLNAGGADERTHAHESLIGRWLDANPPAAGTGWEPYPVSLRIVNWIKRDWRGNALDERATASLAVQARWLEARLETHLLGNHLFTNAKALVHAGLHFEGAEADRWLDTGVGLLLREVPEQILDDGGHFERSPMYHALALEDVLDCINAIDSRGGEVAALAPLRVELARRVPAMLRFLRAMTHADGTLGRFNDCADGIAPDGVELERLASALGLALPPQPEPQGFLHFEQTGYVRAARGAAVALLDTAPIGPDYLPGHGHADTLSFELSIGEQRVVVNGGTSEYGVGPRRQHERSTAAHSTVEVAGESSSETWAGFRVGRRARPRALAVDAGAWTVSCEHDGYEHLRGRPRHRRTWSFRSASVLRVDDSIGESRLPAIARYHLAPGLSIRGDAPRWVVRRGDRLVARVHVVAGRSRIEPSTHASAFGAVHDAQCLAVDLSAGGASTEWSWGS